MPYRRSGNILWSGQKLRLSQAGLLRPPWGLLMQPFLRHGTSHGRDYGGAPQSYEHGPSPVRTRSRIPPKASAGGQWMGGRFGGLAGTRGCFG